MAPYSKNAQESVFKPFIDYKSGKIFRGLEYWKSLADTILEYANHPESKFLNGSQNGKLERRHLKDGEITVIGKETKNIEEQSLKVERIIEYFDEKELLKKILKMTPKEAREKGVSRPTLWKIKQKIKNRAEVNLNNKAVRKLI